jgi:acyl-CoA synthetase (NDP forming)
MAKGRVVSLTSDISELNAKQGVFMKRFFLSVPLWPRLGAYGFAQQSTAFAEKPALVTAIGQSADFEMIKVLLNRAKVPYTADPGQGRKARRFG